MVNHYGTTTIIRQCVRPGMMVRHKDRNFQVLAIPEGKRVIYLNSLIEKKSIKDLIVEVYLDGRGEPLISRGSMQEFEYFVMDGRAKFDFDSAVVFVALGRKLPSNKKLQRDWGEMDAVLVRAPVISDTACGDFELLREI